MFFLDERSSHIWLVQIGNLQQLAEKLQLEIRGIQARRQAQETELASIDNAALRQRFQSALDQLIIEEHEKREEVFLKFNFSFTRVINFIYLFISSMTKLFQCCNEASQHFSRLNTQFLMIKKKNSSNAID